MIAPQKGDFFVVSVGGKRMLVEISSVKNNGVITGWHVNRHGEKVETVTKDAIARHLVIFRLANLRCRMQMNLHYGELEPMESDNAL